MFGEGLIRQLQGQFIRWDVTCRQSAVSGILQAEARDDDRFDDRFRQLETCFTHSVNTEELRACCKLE